jgi:hypothetical protein
MYTELHNVYLHYSCIQRSGLGKIKKKQFTINVKITDDLYQTQHISNGSKINNSFFYKEKGFKSEKLKINYVM